MLLPQHIVHLRLDRARIQAQQLTAAACAPTLSKQFNMLNSSILIKLLNLHPKQFRGQINLAREYHVSFVGNDMQNKPVGITATTSLLKPDADILSRNFIMPQKYFRWDPRLANMYYISAFVHGVIENGTLKYGENDVSVAGWVSHDDILLYPGSDTPKNFKSELDVVMLPCSELRPIDELLPQLRQTT